MEKKKLKKIYHTKMNFKKLLTNKDIDNWKKASIVELIQEDFKSLKWFNEFFKNGEDE